MLQSLPQWNKVRKCLRVFHSFHLLLGFFKKPQTDFTKSCVGVDHHGWKQQIYFADEGIRELLAPFRKIHLVMNMNWNMKIATTFK